MIRCTRCRQPHVCQQDLEPVEWHRCSNCGTFFSGEFVSLAALAKIASVSESTLSDTVEMMKNEIVGKTMLVKYPMRRKA